MEGKSSDKEGSSASIQTDQSQISIVVDENTTQEEDGSITQEPAEDGQHVYQNHDDQEAKKTTDEINKNAIIRYMSNHIKKNKEKLGAK